MSMYMCPCCYKVYDSFRLRVSDTHDGIPHYLCPSITCEQLGINLVELDDPIAKYIGRLNKMGYRTRYCCSGHNYNHYLDIYISFKQDYKFDYLPEDWEYDEGDKKVIRYNISGTNVSNIDIVIGKAMHSLDIWINRMKDDMEKITRNKA